jgi:hypothetical protein
MREPEGRWSGKPLGDFPHNPTPADTACVGPVTKPGGHLPSAIDATLGHRLCARSRRSSAVRRARLVLTPGCRKAHPPQPPTPGTAGRRTLAMSRDGCWSPSRRRRSRALLPTPAPRSDCFATFEPHRTTSGGGPARPARRSASCSPPRSVGPTTRVTPSEHSRSPPVEPASPRAGLPRPLIGQRDARPRCPAHGGSRVPRPLVDRHHRRRPRHVAPAVSRGAMDVLGAAFGEQRSPDGGQNRPPT